MCEPLVVPLPILLFPWERREVIFDDVAFEIKNEGVPRGAR